MEPGAAPELEARPALGVARAQGVYQAAVVARAPQTMAGLRFPRLARSSANLMATSPRARQHAFFAATNTGIVRLAIRSPVSFGTAQPTSWLAASVPRVADAWRVRLMGQAASTTAGGHYIGADRRYKKRVRRKLNSTQFNATNHEEGTSGHEIFKIWSIAKGISDLLYCMRDPRERDHRRGCYRVAVVSPCCLPACRR